MQKYTYTELPADIAETLAVNAGVVLNSFNPLNPPAPSVMKQNIMFATTGGVTSSCIPTYVDYFEDVDNAPKDTKEGKHHDGWEALLSGTGLSYTPENIKSMLGAADIETIEDDVAEGLSVKKITPRDNIQDSDFDDLWYVTDWNKGQGFIAVKYIDALSDGGFSTQSTDNGKGQLSFSYRAHKTVKDLGRPPVEYYVVDTTGATGKYAVTQFLSENITSDFEGVDIKAGEALEINLTAESGYAIETVAVIMGGMPVSGAYENGTVTIAEVTGDVTIIAVEETQGA